MRNNVSQDAGDPALETFEKAGNDGRSRDPDSRVSILETTYGLLGSTPYDKLSMKRIADSAGVSKALLFYFYTSKRELVREALIWGTKREMETFHTCVENGDDESNVALMLPLEEIISSWMKNSLERIQILHTYFEVTDVDDPEDAVNLELKQLFGHIIGYLEVILREQGMNYPREQATLMAVMIDTFGFLPHLTTGSFDIDQYRTALLDLFRIGGNDKRGEDSE